MSSQFSWHNFYPSEVLFFLNPILYRNHGSNVCPLLWINSEGEEVIVGHHWTDTRQRIFGSETAPSLRISTEPRKLVWKRRVFGQQRKVSLEAKPQIQDREVSPIRWNGLLRVWESVYVRARPPWAQARGEPSSQLQDKNLHNLPIRWLLQFWLPVRIRAQ